MGCSLQLAQVSPAMLGGMALKWSSIEKMRRNKVSQRGSRPNLVVVQFKVCCINCQNYWDIEDFT
ncbi:hypothetical protein O9993_19345 [Vibrio lentus]|nr:hypothetical protein [Vibrio lentus]